MLSRVCGRDVGQPRGCVESRFYRLHTLRMLACCSATRAATTELCIWQVDRVYRAQPIYYSGVCILDDKTNIHNRH